jgi:hypothetical protein
MAATGVKRARRAVRWPRALLELASPWLIVRPLRRALRRGLLALAAALPDLLAIEFLLAATCYVFRDAIRDGLVFHEADTSTMFYPVFAALGGALRRGELLVWSPRLFSGFPLLAEGQTGVLYPPNWLAATLLPAQAGFIWLRIVHFALATLFAYVFGRSLRLAPGPSAVLALSFGFGSFMVGQMQHGSVLASAIWLPLVLALTEFGFRARGLARQRYLILAGLALGLSALGVHMQPVVMSGGCFLAWVAFRLVLPPASDGPAADGSDRRFVASSQWQRSGGKGRSRYSTSETVFSAVARLRALPGSADRLDSSPRPAAGIWHVARAVLARVSLAAWTAILVPLIAAATAAAQLLPLYELSSLSGRAGGWSYREATDYSLPLPNLVTLVFPFFFRDGQGGGWSLWQPWEVTYYAGVVPLALAILGVLAARRREVLFFVALVVVATLLALGDYSPLNLYAHVWSWPGFNLQRAPARFSYLGVLGIAALAGLGTQALWDHLRSWPNGTRRTVRLLMLWMAGLLAGLAALLWHLLIWRAWLEAEPLWALEYLDQSYLSQRRDPGVVDSAQKVFSGLWQSLDPTNRHTALSLLLLGALLLLVVCWNEFRRARPFWQGLLVALVALDLGSFAHQYHPMLPIDQVADIGDSGRFLARQNSLVRIYTDPDVKQPRANQLLPWEVAEIRAYDPLELSRHRVLLGSITHVDNWLLDLFGVRYLLLPADQPGQPSYRQTAFNPQHPLVNGSAFSPSGREVWTVPADQADELRVISALEDAFGIEEGDTVAEWVLTDSAGNETVVPMRAGRDTADWTYDDPSNRVSAAHSRARVAFSFELPIPLASGARYANLYYSAFPLPDRPLVTRVEFRHTYPVGRMQVFGFGLFNRERGHLAQFYEREKYRPVFRDSSVVLQENRAAFPRAFAVPEAVVAYDASAALELLAHGPLLPRRQVVLELEDTGQEFPRARPGAVSRGDRLGEPYGDVQVVDYGDALVSVQATTDGGYLVLSDAYYPGWRAYLDGEETRVLRANYAFRAVELPAGQHLVQFRYQPDSFEAGLTITRVTLAVVALALLGSFAHLGRVPRPVRPRSR